MKQCFCFSPTLKAEVNNVMAMVMPEKEQRATAMPDEATRAHHATRTRLSPPTETTVAGCGTNSKGYFVALGFHNLRADFDETKAVDTSAEFHTFALVLLARHHEIVNS